MGRGFARAHETSGSSLADPVHAAPIPPAPQTKPEPSPLLPFDQASRELRAQMLATTEKGSPRCHLFQTTPGLGKSEHALELTAQIADKGGIVLWGCSSRARRDEMAERARKKGILPVVVEGRGPHNCPKWPNVDRATALGYEPARTVCVRCPLFPSNDPPGGPCDYYVQHDRAVAATRRRGRGQSEVVFGTSDAIVAHVQHGQMTADWIVLDEDFQRPLVREATFDAADLVRPIESPDLQRGAALLGRALVTISAEKRDCDVVVTHALVRYVTAAANEEDLSPTQVLTTAISGAPEFGAGALYGIDDATWERVPDRRLANLCEEVLREVTMIGDDSDRAYRARASCEPPPKGGAKRWVYGVVAFAPFEFGGHVVALDAYGAPEIVSRYLAVDLGNPKEWRTVSIRARVADGVSVRHLKTFNGTKRRMGDDFRLRVALDRVVLPELDRLSPRPKVLAAYTWKRHEDAVADALRRGGYDPTYVKHFFQDRGDDRMRACDTIVVVGEPRPNPGAVVHHANAIMEGARVMEGDARLVPFVNAMTTQELAQILHRTRPVIPRPDRALNRILYWGRFPLPEEFRDAAVDKRAPALARAEDRRRVVERICRRLGFWSSDLYMVVHLYGPRLDMTVGAVEQLFLPDWISGGNYALSYIESLFATATTAVTDQFQPERQPHAHHFPTDTYVRSVELGEYGKRIVDGLRWNRPWRASVQQVCEGTFGWTKKTLRIEGPIRGWLTMEVYGDVDRAQAVAQRRGQLASIVQTIGQMKKSWGGTAS